MTLVTPVTDCCDFFRTIDPDSPTVLIIKVLFAQPGLSIAEQGAQGRAKLLGTSFAQYERVFREQMADMFAPGGLDPRRDIAGIILNRWGHAYVNPQPGFFFGVNGKPAPRDVLRNQPHDGLRLRIRIWRGRAIIAILSVRLIGR